MGEMSTHKHRLPVLVLRRDGPRPGADSDTARHPPDQRTPVRRRDGLPGRRLARPGGARHGRSAREGPRGTRLKTGQTVADIGAGTGYMTVKMAKTCRPIGTGVRRGRPAPDDRAAATAARQGPRHQRHAGTRPARRSEAAALDARSRAARGRVPRILGAPEDAPRGYGTRSSQQDGSSCSSTGRRIRRFRSGRSTR